MANVLTACIACGNFIEGSNVDGFVSHGGRCSRCRGERKLIGKFGSLLVQGVMTQRELAELKREFYQLYQIDKKLEERKVEFMRKANEEMDRVIAEVEQQVGQPLKQLRDRKKQLEAQLKAFMEESKTAEMVVRDLLVELRDTVVNRGNMPQYREIVEDLRKLVEWSEEEMETFVRAHYSQPVTAPVMTVKPLPPGRRKLKQQAPPVPGKPVASRILTGSIADDIFQAHRTAGGGTFDMNGRSLAGQPLYAVPLYPDRTVIYPRELTAEDIQSYIDKNADLLADPRNKMGTWLDKETGEHILDVVVAISDRREAMELGSKYNQRAIFDLGNMQEIRTGGSGTPPPNMPPPAQRLPSPQVGDVGFADPTKTEESGILAFHTPHLDLPTMAVMHTDFLKSGASICKVTTPDEVFILTGERVRENGLLTMIALQTKTKETLKVADVENKDDDVIHVLVEGVFASDPNTLRAFLAERIDGYEIADTFYDSDTRVAVELKPFAKLAEDPMAAAMSFFQQMGDTLQALMGLERQKSQVAQMLLGQTSQGNTGGAFDAVDTDDMSLQYERSQPAGGKPGSFGAGTAADGGMMGPNDPAGRAQGR